MKTRLVGRNRIDDYRRIANGLVSRLSSRKGVIGIAFIGGLVRGFVDKYSDLDIVVIISEGEQLREKLYSLSSDIAKQSHVDVDLEIHFVDDFRKRKWDEIDRWEFSAAKIVFDPKGMMKEILERKLTMSKRFWTRRIVIYAEYLKWYCCPPKRGIGTIAESWVKRGDLFSAHYCLSYAADLALKLTFALNKKHLPAAKWRLFYACRLKWKPRNFERLFKESTRIEDFSMRDLDRRLKAIREMWLSIMPRIRDEVGLSLDESSEYYVKKVLRVRKDARSKYK